VVDPERRWFALLAAIRALESECSMLLEASKLADLSWRRACMQRAQFEALRDELEEQLASAARSAPPKRRISLKANA
jgi:hypothetical protein